MPVHKKKNTPPDDKGATPNVVSAEQLKPEHFHQYLRAEIRDATRMVMEDLAVPRDRAGQFHTQAFEQYSRYQPQVARSA